MRVAEERELSRVAGRLSALVMSVLAAADDVAADEGARNAATWLAHHTRAGRGSTSAALRLGVALDARWNLVHATHCNEAELEGVRNRRASIVLCPSTEANLGDGIFDFIQPGNRPALLDVVRTGSAAKTECAIATQLRFCCCQTVMRRWV